MSGGGIVQEWGKTAIEAGKTGAWAAPAAAGQGQEE